MIVDYIIIGQGISGSWLAYYLLKEKQRIIVIDTQNKKSASNVASGLINPVTGRRVVTTWMAEELMPFVFKEYSAFGEAFNTTFIKQKNIIVFPSATDLQQAFNQRIKESNSYIQTPSLKKETLRDLFNFPFDAFEISPCYAVQMHELLQTFRQYLQHQHMLFEELFDEQLLLIKEDSIQYKNIKAKKIIYADGEQSAQSKYWMNLPFVLNKGQALIIKIDDLNASHIYKFGHLTIVPLYNYLWWAGSSNELAFKTNEPTDNFKHSTISSLKSILKIEFALQEHLASVRPATVERRPFVGIHSKYRQIGILNGMGSKGCSLAPWFAKELTENIIYNKPINPLADVQRFSGILSKN